jgi:ribosomal protein S18 acetylase RimI-like enzyme
MDVVLRSAGIDDEGFLWEMLFEAAHAGEDGMVGTDEVRGVPALARYVEGWGRLGDLGVVAVDADGAQVGAAWLRLFAGDDAAYGYVDDETPELAIAVAPGATGSGIGAALLTRLLDDAAGIHPAVSLSVRADNPARRLYERLGFELVDDSHMPNRVGSISVTMIRRL